MELSPSREVPIRPIPLFEVSDKRNNVRAVFRGEANSSLAVLLLLQILLLFGIEGEGSLSEMVLLFSEDKALLILDTLF